MEKTIKRKIQRSFILGDSWLYYKLYTGHKTADRILAEVIGPVTDCLLEEGFIDRWFFIRYADPDFHLRIRFHCKDVVAQSALIQKLRDTIHPYIQSELVWKIQLDTYHRELMRYGEDCIEDAEKLFFQDSWLILKLLQANDLSEVEETRWLFAMTSIDGFLNTFQYDLTSKLTLLEKLKHGFGLEFGMNRQLKKQLDDKYRKHRKKIQQFFEDMADGQKYQVLARLLQERDDSIRIPAESTIRSIQRQRELTLDNVMNSHIHMMMNRLFRSKNRLHELVIYDFLYREYKSKVARQKYAIVDKTEK